MRRGGGALSSDGLSAQEASTLLAVEAQSRGVNDSALAELLKQVESVTGATNQKCTMLLLGADLEVNRAVEHFFATPGAHHADNAEEASTNEHGGTSSPVPGGGSADNSFTMAPGSTSTVLAEDGSHLSLEIDDAQEELEKQKLLDKLHPRLSQLVVCCACDEIHANGR